MGFWGYMLVMELLIPAIMIGFGNRFQKKPPKDINWCYGYRTSRSMKNQDTWLFAHQQCGIVWVRAGWALTPVSVIVMLAVAGRPADTVGTVGGILCVVQILVLLGSIVWTENALKQQFDENGRRRLKIYEEKRRDQ